MDKATLLFSHTVTKEML